MNPVNSSAVEKLLISFWREAPAWKKLQMMTQLNEITRQLVLEGVRRRFPKASHEQLRSMMTEIMFGPKQAARVNGKAKKYLDQSATAPDLLEVTHQVTCVMDYLRVPYVINGSIATIIHGAVRNTINVSIVAPLVMDHVLPLIVSLEHDFHLDEGAIRKAIEERGRFDLLHLTTTCLVEVVVPENKPYVKKQISRRVACPVKPGSDKIIWVLSAEDVVLTQLDGLQTSNGTFYQSWKDILGVLKCQNSALDNAYLHIWAEEMGLSHLLELAFTKARANQ
jgi:hypothetical protein